MIDIIRKRIEALEEELFGQITTNMTLTHRLHEAKYLLKLLEREVEKTKDKLAYLYDY